MKNFPTANNLVNFKLYRNFITRNSNLLYKKVRIYFLGKSQNCEINFQRAGERMSHLYLYFPHVNLDDESCYGPENFRIFLN